MGEVIVLGGYGTVGSACVRELIETTRASVLVAGRSVQRAEEAALAAGKQVRGIYANATDPRTMRALLPGAAAIVCCTGSGTPDALALALEHRIPFVDLEPIALKPEIARELGERAWKAQIPVVLGAGAVPGLPGVLAEYLVRRLTECDWIHVASTGPWRGSTAADRDIEQLWKIRRPGLRLADQPTVLETSALRTELSIQEECIRLRVINDDGFGPGTLVSVTLDTENQLNVSAAIKYVQSYIRFLPVAVYCNGEIISQQKWDQPEGFDPRTTTILGSRNIETDSFSATIDTSHSIVPERQSDRGTGKNHPGKSNSFRPA